MSRVRGHRLVAVLDVPEQVAHAELAGRVGHLDRAVHDLGQAGRRSLCFGWAHGSALPVRSADETGAAGTNPRDIIGHVKFLRMKPGHGEVLLAEGDPRVREDEERLVEEFRRQLDEGMWAAVPTTEPGSGRREAQMVKEYARHPAGRRARDLLPARLGRLSRRRRCCSRCSRSRWSPLVLAAPIAARRDRGLARRARAGAGARSPASSPCTLYDPGRERRAEQRARELLRSCVNDEEWAMYRDLGFIRVAGRHARREPTAAAAPAYAYLVYPHKPIVAYVPGSGQLLSEYCVEFPDLTAAAAARRLPASDDVLAKWMALTSDEDRVIRRANMHLVGPPARPRAACAATCGGSPSGSAGARDREQRPPEPRE